jgi:serine phosphatase RsbU (regulator of sigma subunit)
MNFPQALEQRYPRSPVHPSAPPRVNGVSLTTRTIAANGGTQSGDWCETLELSDELVLLSIGDVCGHGAPTIGTMEMMRQLIRDGAQGGLRPAQMIAAVNLAACDLRPDTYVTAVVGVLDTRRGELCFANAGHPQPLLTGKDGQRFLGPRLGSLLLGVDPAAATPEQRVQIPADGLLVLYTDGVTERNRDAGAGRDELAQAALFAHRYSALPAASVIERQMFLTGGNEDDAAILAVRMPVSKRLARRSAR